jgi:hypothetical protein
MRLRRLSGEGRKGHRKHGAAAVALVVEIPLVLAHDYLLYEAGRAEWGLREAVGRLRRAFRECHVDRTVYVSA